MEKRIPEKTYDPATVEQRLYEGWERKGYFHAEVDRSKKPYCIVIPPPNITGQLHMGHAWDNTVQDALTRYHRMKGYCTLWLPGTDHASIATEVKIVNQMAKEGLTKADIGREKFLERAWDWRRQYGGTIVKQLRKLGSSCDWQRERFTMDEGCNRAVIEVFCRLYEKGLIYRGNRIINWCPDCKTALSDAEVEYEEKKSHLWHLRYPVKGMDMYLVVATTRPETMLGDTAIAVNPNDERYKALIGKKAILPLLYREIPIVADDYVDMEFGTGAVKVTPAHDPNDFEIGIRHSLPMIRVLNDDGTVNEHGGPYAGMDRYEARKKIVEDLDKEGLLEKIEDYTHNVGHCYRCHDVVEPISSLQWFVSMKELAEPAIECVKSRKTQFIPERYEKTYMNWMENIRDWCISRQLWWGHRIPAYYCECGEVMIARTAPDKCSKCGSVNITQDEDVLDTWFSSGLWPFSTLGWPDKTPELDYFYPTDVLVTGYDIIFFWVARMIFFGMEVMGKEPFHHVNIHGLLRDSQGRKMSKSLNNGVDPLDVIEKYGADALRFSIVIGNSPGNDMRFYWEKVESYRNFTNKIWNAFRFVMMNLGEDEIPPIESVKNLDISDKWILHRLNGLIKDVTDNIESFDLGLAAQKVYDFIWSEYCDWYIEMAKQRLREDGEGKETAQAVLVHVLKTAMKLLHPFMPFISEEVYSYISDEETIMLSAWPEADIKHSFTQQAEAMEGVMEIIRAIRNLRAEMNVPMGKKTKVIIVAPEERHALLRSAESYLLALAWCSRIEVQTDKAGIPENAACAVSEYGSSYIPLEELVDVAKETERLKKEETALTGEIERAKAKLANPGFTAKAPAHVVEEERRKLEKAQAMLIEIGERLKMLNEMKN